MSELIISKRSSLTPDRVRSLLDYNPLTGVFTWKKTRGGRLAGSIAGHINPKTGYVNLGIDGVVHDAHRLAWLYQTNSFPKLEIDHFDTVRSNNSFANLREVDRITNMQNQRVSHKQNKTGFLGVHKDKKSYVARILVGGRKIRIGCFGTPEEAHDAYVTTKRMLHAGATL